MDSRDALRRFFEQQLVPVDDAGRRFGLDEQVPAAHLVPPLVERTVRRAALDAAVHRSSGGAPSEQAGREVSWKRCLMIAALTELRGLRRARSQQA